jgi:hypothetical protein
MNVYFHIPHKSRMGAELCGYKTAEPPRQLCSAIWLTHLAAVLRINLRRHTQADFHPLL